MCRAVDQPDQEELNLANCELLEDLKKCDREHTIWQKAVGG